MSNNSLAFLRGEIGKRITSFDKKRTLNRRFSSAFFLSTSLLAVINSVLLGLKSNITECIRIAALVISSLIVFINAWQALFNNRSLWVAYNDALNGLYKLKFDIEYREQGGTAIQDTEVAGYKKSYQDILDTLNAVWDKARTVQSPTKADGKNLGA